MNTDAPRSYDPEFFPELAEIETRHFWFRTRKRVIATLAEQITDRWADGYRVLEVGCGTGDVLQALEKACARGRVFGMDLFAEGLALARRRTLRPLVQGSIEEPSFGGEFDLIGAFDVIEHLDDDLRVLRSVRAMLKPGGVLLLTVPAHRSLWSYFDEVSHHRRRYEANELCTKLNGSGYRVEFCSLFMAATYPILWFTRRIRSMRHASDPDSTEVNRALTLKELRIIRGVNGLLTFLLMPEASLVKSRIRLPFGSSLIAVATRTE